MYLVRGGCDLCSIVFCMSLTFGVWSIWLFSTEFHGEEFWVWLFLALGGRSSMGGRCPGRVLVWLRPFGVATQLERSGRHLWMNLKMEMALWFPASLGIVTNLEVSPSKKTCAFGKGYGDCRLQVGASSCGWSYQFIVQWPIVNRPILTFKHLLYLFRNYGFRNSEFPNMLQHQHGVKTPSPSSFTGCHRGACSGNSSRSLHQAMSLLPWYPPWRAPKTRQLRGDKRRAAGFDAWAVSWWWWCGEGIKIGIMDSKTAVLSGSLWVHSLHA